MASSINSGNIKIMRSQVLLDTADGGGQMTAHEVANGQSNNLFPDTSELDRAYGRINLRKGFLSVQTADTDSLMGANVIVADVPQDEQVNVTLFTTKNWFDRRAAAQDHIERYMARSVVWAGHLLEKQLIGQRAIQLALRETDDVPKVDQCLCLVENEDTPTEFEQYVRVTKVTTAMRMFGVGSGEVSRKVATVEISDPLRYTFTGLSVREFEAGAKSPALCRDTAVADAASYYGAAKLKKPLQRGDVNVAVSSIFTQLVPSAQRETVLADVNPAGLKSFQTRAGVATVSVAIGGFSAQKVYKYLGQPIMPNSLFLTADGETVSDDGAGSLVRGERQVGTVEYSKGVLSVSVLAGMDKNWQASFTPAATVSRVSETDMIEIDGDSRGYNYTRTLLPPPEPATLVISYESQGKTYYLYEQGDGSIKSTDSGYGSGTLSFESGTVVLTTGALPDADSAILFSWGTRSTIVEGSDYSKMVSKPAFMFALNDDGVSSEHYYANIVLAWGDNKSARGGTGKALSGDAFGWIGERGRLFVRPHEMVAPNTLFRLNFNQGSTLLRYNRVLQNGAAVLYDKLVKGSVEVSLFGSGGVIARSLYDRDLDSQYVVVVAKVWAVEPLFDDGNGGLWQRDAGKQVGTVDYVTGEIKITQPVACTLYKQAFYGDGSLKSTDFVSANVLPEYFNGRELSAKFLSAEAGGESIEKLVYASELVLDLALPSNAELVSDSLAFLLGNRRYVERGGVLYHSIDADTDVGVMAGRVSGNRVVITDWATGGDFVLQSFAVQITQDEPKKAMYFRVPVSPVRAGSVQLVYELDGVRKTVTADTHGVMADDVVTGSVNYSNGVVKLAFNQALNGRKIRYSAVAYSYIPLSADILGLDPVRLPSDGRVPIYRTGDVVVVHHTQRFELSAPTAGKSYSVGRERLSFLKVVDSDGKPLNYELYDYNLDAGTLQLKSNYTAAGLKLPLFAEHRIEDMGLLTDVQINGLLSLSQPLTHDFPQDGTLVSSALVAGDLQARAHNVFAQNSWESKWADASTDVMLAQFNEVQFPIVVSNEGAQEERWALVFTNNTAFRVIGEHLGQVATGNVNEDCAPVNPITGKPYFRIPQGGWGEGWSAGNVLRFNTAAANYPIWLARTVLQGQSGVLSDRFCMMARGDVDR